MAICHEVDYEVKGDDLQFVEIGLDPGETVVAEAGAMMFLEEGIAFETKMGDGSDPDAGMFKKLKSAAGRAISQESVFLTHFTNQGGGRKVAAFGSDTPGKIVPLDMAQFGGSILAQKDAFLAAAFGTKLSVAFNRKLGSGFFGGEGFILQRLEGDGMAFLNAGGTIVEKHLAGETLRVDTGCLVAFEDGVDYSIERAGNLKSMVGVAAVAAVLPPRRPDHPARPGGRRHLQGRGLRPRRPRPTPGLGRRAEQPATRWISPAGGRASWRRPRCRRRSRPRRTAR